MYLAFLFILVYFVVIVNFSSKWSLFIRHNAGREELLEGKRKFSEVSESPNLAKELWKEDNVNKVNTEDSETFEVRLKQIQNS